MEEESRTRGQSSYRHPHFRRPLGRVILTHEPILHRRACLQGSLHHPHQGSQPAPPQGRQDAAVLLRQPPHDLQV